MLRGSDVRGRRSGGRLWRLCLRFLLFVVVVMFLVTFIAAIF